MRAFSVLPAFLLLAANTWAATIINPAQDTTWAAGTDGQTVAWTSVSTDPPMFSLMLANMVRFRPTPEISLLTHTSAASNP